MDLATFVYIGSALGFVFGISLLFNRRVRSTELSLAAGLLAGLSIAMAAITAEHEQVLPVPVFLSEAFEFATALCMGPLLYLFIRSRKEGRWTFRWPDPIHFLPALAVSLAILMARGSILPFRAVMLLQIAYTAVCAFLVTNRGRTVHSGQAERLYWPRRFVALAIIIHGAQIVRTLLFDVGMLRNIVPVTAVASLFVLSTIAFRRSILETLASTRLTDEKYIRSSLTAEDASRVSECLEKGMSEGRLYADPDLNLDRLAAGIGTSPHTLSRVLNERLERTFFEYVAEFRLEDSKRRLADPANDTYTIDAIAEAAGFSSRSTFYSAFRRAFSMTPTAYRSQIRSKK